MIHIYYLFAGIGLFYILHNNIDDTHVVDNIINEFLNKKNILIIDVRKKDEYILGSYTNSINIPHDEINNLSIINIKKRCNNCKYLIYCRTGRRAKIAFQKLKNLGLKNVYYTTFDYETLLKKTN